MLGWVEGWYGGTTRTRIFRLQTTAGEQGSECVGWKLLLYEGCMRADWDHGYVAGLRT